MRHFLLFLFLLLAQFAQTQNLVPNGDFEQYDTCQTNAGQLYRALYWNNPMPSSTPDYFNACNPFPNTSVPSNRWGYETAHSGIAYAAIGTAVDSALPPNINGDYREYLQVELTDTLTGGNIYTIKFYVSACDTMNYVSNDMGVYFSKTEVYDTCLGCALPYLPQFENTTDLGNRHGWTELKKNYTATGGEKFIVIGNFKDSLHTSTTYTNWTSYNKNRNTAAYYVDDVSVILYDTVSGVLDNWTKTAIKIYPNPTCGMVNINFPNYEELTLDVLDVSGALVLRKINFKNKDSPVNLLPYADGIYLFKFTSGNYSYQSKVVKN